MKRSIRLLMFNQCQSLMLNDLELNDHESYEKLLLQRRRLWNLHQWLPLGGWATLKTLVERWTLSPLVTAIAA